MKPAEFCTWLKGFVDLCELDAISPTQWQVIKQHLDQVGFEKVGVPNHSGPLFYPPGVRSDTPVYGPVITPARTRLDGNTINCADLPQSSSIPSDCML